MESEKVKEIKKALECMSGLCKDSLSSICFECEIDKKYDEESACKEALTLINELESENEKFRKHHTENKRLRTKIANLKATISKQQMEYELLKCGKAIGEGIVEVANKTKEKLELLEFAQRLKEKIYSLWRGRQLVELLCDIDETLKEFIDD